MKNIIIFLVIFTAACTNTPVVVTNCPCQCDTTVVHPPPQEQPFMFGVNTNTWQPISEQTKFRTVRLYQWSGSFFTEKGWYGQPLLQGQKQVLGLDDYLMAMKAAGTDVIFTITGSPDWINGHTDGYGTNSWPPIRQGMNRQDPASYQDFAGICKAVAVRYGSRTMPAGTYAIDPAGPRWNGDTRQEYKSGLGLIKYIEPGNEWDCWWHKGTEQYMEPEEMTALLKACFDAIKSVDPDMKIVMPGLTNFDLVYLKRMLDFCNTKGWVFPADVVNVHHYSSTGNNKHQHPPTWPLSSGCPPELDKDFTTAGEVVTWAKTIGKPAWITEFGYDTEPGSQIYPYQIVGASAEETQSQWIVKSLLAYKEQGMSRAYIFTLADEPNGSGTFSHCGLLRGEHTGYTEKPAMLVLENLTIK